jgi:predicted MFS family arabinose efflux permease
MTLSDAANDECKQESLIKSFKALVSNRRYIFFVIICFIIGLAFRTIRLLLPLIIDSVKGDSGDLGLAYFFGVIMEIPMFLASKKLTKKFKPNILILISVILYLIEFLILIIAASPFMVMVAMIAQGLAFGTYLPSVRLFVYENSPENLRTSAQTLADAIYSSLTAVIGTAAGGIIIEKYGVKAVLFIGIGLLSLALIILIISSFIKSKKRTSNTR